MTRILTITALAIALGAGIALYDASNTSVSSPAATVTKSLPTDLKVEPRTGQGYKGDIQPAAKATPESINQGTVVTTFKL